MTTVQFVCTWTEQQADDADMTPTKGPTFSRALAKQDLAHFLISVGRKRQLQFIHEVQ